MCQILTRSWQYIGRLLAYLFVLTVLVKVARHKKGIQTEEMKQYVAWYLEQHHQQNLGVRIVLIFDFTDAGITNMVRFKPSVVLQLVEHFRFCHATPPILGLITKPDSFRKLLKMELYASNIIDMVSIDVLPALY